MSRYKRPDRAQQRKDEAKQRQAEYVTLTADEKAARDSAWRAEARRRQA